MKRNLFAILITIILSGNTFSQSLNVVGSDVCFGQNAILTATTSLNINQIKSIYWDLNNDGLYDDAFGKTISHYFEQADTFLIDIELIDTADNVFHLLTKKQFIVNPLPNVNFIVDNKCARENANYISISTISSGTLNQFSWDFNNDNNIDEIVNNQDTVIHNNGPFGVYTCKLEVTSDFGCSSFTTKTLEIFEIPEISFNYDTVCLGSKTTLNAISNFSDNDILQYSWSIENESITGKNIEYLFSSPGDNNIEVNVISKNYCNNSISGQVKVNSLPIVNIINSGNDYLNYNESTSLSVSNYSSIQWNTGSNLNQIEVTTQGEYIVVVYDENNCSNSDTLFINAVESISTNEIISPNSDGVNDYLVIDNIESYGELEIYIYDQYGKLIYYNSNYSNDWDAKYNGNLLNAGSYYYLIKGNNISYKGNINIIR